jgi:hypothetical protein
MNTQAVALAAARLGGIAAGTSWSLKDCPSLSSSNNRNDVMFVWGNRHEEIFRRSGALIQRFVVSGYPATEAANRAKKDPNDDRRRICFYDNVAHTDTLISESQARQAYVAFLDFSEAMFDLVAIFKTKRDDFRRLGPIICERVDRLVTAGRAELRTGHGDLASGLEADLVVGFGASSLALLAAQHGRPCVLFDPEGVMQNSPGTGLSNLYVTASAEAFGTALAFALESADAIEPTGGAIDAFADTEGHWRVARYLSALVDAFRGGLDAANAIAHGEKNLRETASLKQPSSGVS